MPQRAPGAWRDPEAPAAPADAPCRPAPWVAWLAWLSIACSLVVCLAAPTQQNQQCTSNPGGCMRRKEVARYQRRKRLVPWYHLSALCQRRKHKLCMGCTAAVLMRHTMHARRAHSTSGSGAGLCPAPIPAPKAKPAENARQRRSSKLPSPAGPCCTTPTQQAALAARLRSAAWYGYG
jgi:hypothetical protein